MSFTIPIIAACQAGIGLGPSNHSSHSSREDAGPAMNLQVSISIPIKEQVAEVADSCSGVVQMC